MAAPILHQPRDGWMTEPVGDPLREMLRRSLSSGWPALRAPGAMRVDVTENDEAYTVMAEIPGARTEDIAVRIDGRKLSIDADIKEEKATGGRADRVVTHELYRGSMTRALTLAHEVDDREASARLENGILSLILPKRDGRSRAALEAA